MKNFTLLLAFALVSGTIAAQTQFKQQTQKQATKQVTLSKKDARLKLNQIKEEKPALYMPLEQEEWFYDEEEGWIPSGNYYLTYDKQGNMLTNKYVDEFGQLHTAYEYNENSLWTSKIESQSEDGEEWEQTSKQTRAFDNIVKELVVESYESVWDGEDWSLVDYGRTWIRQITRDESNRITSILHKTFYMGEFKDFRRITITYNNDGLAETWKYEQLNEDEEWEEFYTLIDMEWYLTDGQIVAESLDAFYTGNNRLKKAIVMEQDVKVGSIEASYKENGDYSYTYGYYNEDDVMTDYDLHTITYNDEYGSYTTLSEYYFHVDEDGEPLEEDELLESIMETVTYDSHGEVIKEEQYFDGELAGGAKYDITYDGDKMIEWMYSEYDYDMEDYTPFIKLISKNFVNVTTPVNKVMAEETSGEQAVYNLQGMKVASSTESLPAGLYIVKKEGKTIKVLKK